MGRRSRQREKAAAEPPKPRPVGQANRMARVQVDDDVWREFRALAGRRPVSAVLGELVEREVERGRSDRLRDGELDGGELVAALDRARMQQEELASIVSRLEELQRDQTAADDGH